MGAAGKPAAERAEPATPESEIPSAERFSISPMQKSGSLDEPQPASAREAVADEPRRPAASAQGSDSSVAKHGTVAPTARPESAPENFDERQFEPEKETAEERNLSFDFDDEPAIEPGEAPAEEAGDDRWEVGGENAPDAEVGFDEPAIDRAASAPASLQEEATELRGPLNKMPAAARLKRPASDEDLFLERRRSHSAGFFLAMFFLVALGFAGVTMVICGAPVASARLLRGLPMLGPSLETEPPLESMVALNSVRAYYEQIKDGGRALVIVGQATNGAATPLHMIQIGVRVLDASSRALAVSSVYCGQTLSEKMLAEMTPHEIEFLQKLPAQKSFVLEPTQTAPFVSVFINPPANPSRFAVSVVKVTEAAAGTEANSDALP